MMNNEFVYGMIRRKLGLKKYQLFQFANQISSQHYYYFTRNKLIKTYQNHHGRFTSERDSGVSLNFLMSKDCRIKKYEQKRINKHINKN